MAHGQEAAPTEETVGTDVDAADTEAAPAADPFDQKLIDLVGGYYAQIGSEASPIDTEQGVRAIKLMLVDGVSLDRIEAAVRDAVALHTPGRRIPFQVAVPLRVRPAGAAPVERPRTSQPNTSQRPSSSGVSGAVIPPPPDRPSTQPGDDPSDRAGTVIEERWVKRQEELRQRRNRLRLYLQWRDRTREKRILMSVGIPMFAAGWAGTWALAGGTLSTGQELPSVGWTAAIPIAGPFIFGALTEGQYPPVFVFGGFQGIGLVLTIAGIAQKHDLPYDRDPTAMRIGKDPRTGRAVMTLSPRPMGLGGGVVGRF